MNEEVEEEEGTVSRPVSAAAVNADKDEKTDTEKADTTKKAAAAGIGRDGTMISLHKSGLGEEGSNIPDHGRDKDLDILHLQGPFH